MLKKTPPQQKMLAAPTMTLYEAIQQEKTFITREGYECVVFKHREGKVKVRAIRNGKLVESNWMPIENLKIKENADGKK